MKDRLLTDIKDAKVLEVFEKYSNIEIRYVKDGIEKSLSIYHNCRFSSMGSGCWFEFSGIPLHKYNKKISKRLKNIDTIKEINLYHDDNGLISFYHLEIVYLQKNQTKSYLLSPKADKKYELEVFPNKKLDLKKSTIFQVPYPKELYSTDIYKTALAFALKAHGEQKTPDGLLYSFHIVSVANEIINSLSLHRISYDEANVSVACALLHDVNEDTDTEVSKHTVDLENIKEITAGVEALTKDKNLPKEEQLQDSLERLKEMPYCIQMVKLADRITNLAPAPLFWNKAKRKSYKNEAKMILKALKESNPYLANKLQNKIDNYTVDGTANRYGAIKSDDYLVFYTTDEKYLIFDKSHENYLTTFKAINKINEKLGFFVGFRNIAKENLKNFIKDKMKIDEFTDNIGLDDERLKNIDKQVILSQKLVQKYSNYKATYLLLSVDDILRLLDD